jgi:cation diffusion facilitator family transporter
MTHDTDPTSHDHGLDHDRTHGRGTGHDHDHDHDHDHPKGLLGVIKEIFAPHSHDASDSIDGALESSAAGIRAVKISLLALGATSIAQLVIVVISGSVALLADTIHNFSDALTAIPLWIAFALGTKTATRRYTYGYGRVEDLAGLFVIAMITLSAIIAAVESVRRLIHPVAIQHVGWVAAAGLVGFIGNELVAIYRIRVGRQIGSAALIADGLHARTDGFTSLAVLLGAGGVALGFPLADPIIGLLITVAILAVLRTAVRDVFRRLLDAIDPDLFDAAEAALAAEPGVTAVRSVKMRWIGHRIHADAELDVDPTISLSEAHRIAHHAEHTLTHAVPKLSSALIHAYPATGTH